MPSNAIFLPRGMRGAYSSGLSKGLSPRGDIGSMSGFTISRKTFENIENFIADNEASVEKVYQGLDALARGMVLVIKGIAQQKSGGPVAPRQRSNPALAYRIPVQRITGRYFAGWTVKRVGPAHYKVYNDVFEAYLIEYGIFQRVRRPILKMSLIGMLGMMQASRTGDRFLENVLAPRRSSKGQFQSLGVRLMGTETLGGLAGPQGRLP